MSTFRYKPKKSYSSSKNITTLETEHKKKEDYFTNRKDSLPEKKIELEKYIEELKKLNNKNPSKYNDDDIQNKAKLKDKITDLEKEINIIENNVEEINYYSKTCDILLDYYNEYDTVSEEKSKMAGSIMDFFKGSKKDKSNKNNKAVLFDNYKSLVDSTYNSKTKVLNFIKYCKGCNIEKILNQTEGIYECTNCGETELVIIESDRPNYKDPIPDNSAYAYKRINHLNEILSQFQAKESTEISKEVYDSILVEIGKRKIPNLAKLTPNKMRDILKKLRLHRYYEHVPHIINKLNGLPPPTMSRNTEEKIRHMFKAIQEPFTKFCPKGRKNFLSYNYVLHKFCELLMLDQFITCFPLLKSREKLKQQDIIWEKICKYLGWEFIESI